MKTEIGLFDDWAKINIENYCDAIFNGQYYVMRENSRLTKEKKNFLILSLNTGLKSWCASASREGYKLVPVDLLKRCISHIATAECHPNNSKQDEELMANDMKLIEQAMMGVVNE